MVVVGIFVGPNELPLPKPKWFYNPMNTFLQHMKFLLFSPERSVNASRLFLLFIASFFVAKFFGFTAHFCIVKFRQFFSSVLVRLCLRSFFFILLTQYNGFSVRPLTQHQKSLNVYAKARIHQENVQCFRRFLFRIVL